MESLLITTGGISLYRVPSIMVSTEIPHRRDTEHRQDSLSQQWLLRIGLSRSGKISRKAPLICRSLMSQNPAQMLHLASSSMMAMIVMMTMNQKQRRLPVNEDERSLRDFKRDMLRARFIHFASILAFIHLQALSLIFLVFPSVFIHFSKHFPLISFINKHFLAFHSISHFFLSFSDSTIHFESISFCLHPFLSSSIPSSCFHSFTCSIIHFG